MEKEISHTYIDENTFELCDMLKFTAMTFYTADYKNKNLSNNTVNILKCQENDSCPLRIILSILK